MIKTRGVKMNNAYFVIGAPGCGKGTAIKLLFPDERQVVSMSAELLALLNDPVCGGIIKDSINRGFFVPSEIAIPVFEKKWNAMNHGNDDIVLDGVVRTEIQRLSVVRMVHRSGYNPVYVFIDTDLKECQRRMLKIRHRPDDTPEIIANRFMCHKAFTVPVIESLRQWGKLITINGNQAPYLVAAEAVKKLGLT